MFGRSRDEIKAGWPGARVAYCAMAYQFAGDLILPEHPGGSRPSGRGR